MTTTNHRQPSSGNSGRGAFPKCHGGCDRHVLHATGELAWCPTCWYLEETLRKEKSECVSDLRERRDRTLGRATDLLRRTYVDDADLIVRALEKL